MIKLCLLLLPFMLAEERPKPPSWLPNPAGALQTYRQNLNQLRHKYPTTDSVPDLKFFLFGMGNRLKLIYRDGRLLNARTGNIEWQWNVQEEIRIPSEYTVQMDLRTDQADPPRLMQIREDETGVWILQTGRRPRLIRGTQHPLRLPRFESNPNGPVLRVLLQEVLVNVLNNKPLSNFFVYDAPRSADVSLIRTVLQRTENTNQINKIDAELSGTLVEQDHEERPISTVDYPLSWERNAPGAHYPGLTVLEKSLVKQRLILPQAGYAAGLFLQLDGRH